MKYKIAIPTFIVAVVATATFGAVNTFAQAKTTQHDSIVQKLVQKFNLNEDQVKAVFEEERTERQAEMQTKFEERLNQSVSEGKITEDQKKLIIAKHEEEQNEREADRANWQNLTSEERRSQMDEHRTEMQSWAEENGIDMQYFMQGFKGEMRGGWHAK